MDVETFLAKLQKARYFEGYTDAAIVKATKAIRKRLAAELAGASKDYFERFPGLALVVTDVDHEMTGLNDLKDILRQLGDASFGLFAPRGIRIRRKAGENRHRLEFAVNDTQICWTFEDESWIPNAFFEELDKLTRQHCSGLMFHAVAYPDSGQSGFYVWCTSRAVRAIARAGLIPSDKHPLDPLAEELSATLPEQPAKSPPAAETTKPLEFPPPADLVRSERIGVYRKGRWRIPTLSQKTIAGWKDISAAEASSVVGDDLTSLIRKTFDLLCAAHCGLTGIGDATSHARQVVTLVERYLFGAWRVGHIEEGVTLTEATARKELPWTMTLGIGCAAAVSLGDEHSFTRFLEYPRGDVYCENMEDELAYLRLLSDMVLKRNQWDWDQQADLIAQGSEDRFPKLLRCLEGLKTDDEKLFQKAIRKFGAKPRFRPPSWFRGAVDCDVTVLAELARQRGWSSDEFSEHLQDRILDRRLVQEHE